MGNVEANPSSRVSSTYPEKEEKSKLWGILVFGIIGATATTLAVGQLKKSREWFHQAPFTRTGTSGTGSGSTYRTRTASQEDAWKRYNRRMQEELEDEMERVERIRRMQSVFNRERSKNQKRYETWTENQQNAYTQDFQRHDWYWKAEHKFKDHRNTNFNCREHPKPNASSPLSHHYTVLGLDRCRTERYTDTEIKKAFRAKALQFHPDQNQENTEAAEAKFKEVMTSYEAIKNERKSMK